MAIKRYNTTTSKKSSLFTICTELTSWYELSLYFFTQIDEKFPPSWNLKVHYCVYNSPQQGSTHCQKYLTHTITIYFVIHLNVLPSHLCLSPQFRFSDCIFYLPHE
jgi:hypothetical protein